MRSGSPHWKEQRGMLSTHHEPWPPFPFRPVSAHAAASAKQEKPPDAVDSSLRRATGIERLKALAQRGSARSTGPATAHAPDSLVLSVEGGTIGFESPAKQCIIEEVGMGEGPEGMMIHAS